tara:strand:+ start:1517 stop:2809 length:1293 start_codon:yes stop_codon:yes gene_type:complete
MKVHLNPLSNSNTNNSVEILSIGTEILLGNIVNTNSQWIAQELSFLGINHFRQTTIGDNLDRVSNLVLEISQRCNLLITTGGLGPTPDDLTTEAIAKAFNHSLFERANIWTGIKQKINRDLTNIETSYLKKQCLFPKNASIINNPRGIAPGMIWQPLKNFTIMTFPGVPEELKDMWRETGKDYINKYFSEDKIFFSNTLKFAGIGESSVTEKITELLELKNPTVAPYANIGEVKIRITAKATNISEATSLIKPVKEKIVKQFPTNIIGENEDTLASVLVSELSHRKESLAFAESCTGGLLSSFITSIPGSSKVFKGSIIAYKNEIKQSILNVPNDLIEKYGAVSEEVAKSMVIGLKKILQSDWGIAISGIAGPDGGSEYKPIGLVYISIIGPNNEIKNIKKIFNPNSNRIDIQRLSVNECLNSLRLILLS